jgi:predicted transcriptional regulator
MRKTSIYLDDTLTERLRRTAEIMGKSQATVIREAILQFTATRPKRVFAMDGAGEGPGGSVEDIPEEELLRGFGE